MAKSLQTVALRGAQRCTSREQGAIETIAPSKSYLVILVARNENSPRSSGGTNSSCQWLTWIGLGFLNCSKLLGKGRGTPGNEEAGQESLGGTHLHSLCEKLIKCVLNNLHLKHLFHGEFRNLSGYLFPDMESSFFSFWQSFLINVGIRVWIKIFL